MRKIILDTDIGSDIDDAVCLSYLLFHPECALLGITTVSGEPLNRAMLCDVLCRAAGKNVPIYPGAETPFITAQRQPLAKQSEKLSHYEYSTDYPTCGAIEFMRDTIMSNPHEVDLLAIGPMTNVALLFAVYPETIPLLKGLTLMCGDFIRENAITEWNAVCDPYASRIVYNANVNIHRSIGLNVTTKVKMPASETRQRFNHPVLRIVSDFAEVWFREREELTFHDPLAAAILFNDNICSFAKGNVALSLGGDGEDGHTVFTAASGGRHQVADSVVPSVFFEEFFSVLK